MCSLTNEDILYFRKDLTVHTGRRNGTKCGGELERTQGLMQGVVWRCKRCSMSVSDEVLQLRRKKAGL